MKNPTTFILVLVLVCAAFFIGRQTGPAPTVDAWPTYEDGTYRGGFYDNGYIQVNVEITLKDNVVTAANFRHLWRDEQYHLEADQEPFSSVIRQYQETLDHLVGKDLRRHLHDLYHPENIVTTEVHGYTAATLRSNKIISSVHDAINRGVYTK